MNTLKRAFIPGDEWLYFKLYTGPKTTDFILSDVIKPIVERLFKGSHIKTWFFIRYKNPEFHLRIRFQLKDDLSVGEVITIFNDYCRPYVENEFIWRIQLDTYQREMERYYYKAICEFESFSYYDSEMIINVLSGYNDELRWLFGLKAIDSLLSGLNFNLDHKLNFIEHLKTSFCEEFEVDKHFRKQLNKKYIHNKTKIENFIFEYQYKSKEQTMLKKIVDKKSENILLLSETIITELNHQQLHSFLSSHVHMMMNRLFRTKQRVCEMVIYYFLYKHYKSLIGIEKHLSRKPMINLKQ